MKSFLQNSDIETYSTPNKGKSVIPGRFIRILQKKIYKYLTSVSKNVYIDKLNDKINKYNNTYQKTIKMKPVDVKPNIYTDFNEKNNKEDPKLQLVVMLEYHNIKILLEKAMFRIGLSNFCD